MEGNISKIALVSSDLNGTLVHQHTMSDMIQQYVGEEQFRKADVIFKQQTSGRASMEEAFSNAGPLTRGLTLRQAIEYTRTNMKYVDGFFDFVDALASRSIPFVINSTGYSVTLYSIREQVGSSKIHGFIGNYLEFGWKGDVKATLEEDELEKMVQNYFRDAEVTQRDTYDLVRATGSMRLGITDEAAKARLIIAYAGNNFPEILPVQIAHIGDTMGDSGGILGIAEAGGQGIAFNFNEALLHFLQGKVVQNPNLEKRIHYVDSKGPASDLRHVLPILLS